MINEPSKRRYLSLWFPFLSADRLRLRETLAPAAAGHAPPQAPPQVFIAKIKGAARLVKVDQQAMALGLWPGMTLADARARIPILRAVAVCRAADADFLAHLADLCGTYTPSVAHEEPDGLVLDITGCAHLFGDESGLVLRLQSTLHAAGLTVTNAAVAATPEMARALARFGKEHPIITHGDQQARALGVAALECDAGDALALKRAGLRTIGDVADRPSVLFSVRFSPAFTTRLRRLLGAEDRRIAPLRAQPCHRLDHQCPEPILSATVISGVLEGLIQRAARSLEERGEGGRVFEAIFFRTDGAVRRIRIETSQATRNPAVIQRLYRDRLDALADPLDPGFGFDLISLHVVRTEPCDARQTSLDARAVQDEQIATLVDRLSAIFGKQRISRLLPVETHIPERAQRTVTASATRPSQPWPEPAAAAPPSRPLYLFERPHLIEMQAASPDRKIPAHFRWRRMPHDIIHAEGPERIADEWWRSPSDYGTRDYYRIETAQGRRFWIFRAATPAQSQPMQWFLHGIFA